MGDVVVLCESGVARQGVRGDVCGADFSLTLVTCQEGGAPISQASSSPSVRSLQISSGPAACARKYLLKARAPSFLHLWSQVPTQETRRSTTLTHTRREEQGGGRGRRRQRATGGVAACRIQGSVLVAAGILICQGWWISEMLLVEEGNH